MAAVTKKGPDERRTCPVCGDEFLWSATQRFWFYRRNASDAEPTCPRRRCIARRAGRHRRLFDDVERRCSNCGDPFTWTSEQQATFYRERGRETELEPGCSSRCTRALSVRKKDGSYMPGPWAYSPEERTCPVCGTEFVWTAKQQWQRARNVARGGIRFVDSPPACLLHATTLSRRLAKGHSEGPASNSRPGPER